MSSERARKILYRGLGCVAVALGFVGVLVPGMPTTVFVLVASYFFGRSSPRLEGWLLRHRWFGPPLRRFRETGGITRAGKVAALGSMWTAVLISAGLLVAASGKAALAAILLACVGTLTILFAVRTIPERT
ncbi:YbaN family protein [uncultured Paludibaculum sp.]|uniref:YbaN family protein n=1 Tax=uncultured Paludibaculum sp. TaxID=1765020 RepID=UPI002AAA7633|nr:YbaN family protein [uncultured Paludibaculum sp.]